MHYNSLLVIWCFDFHFSRTKIQRPEFNDGHLLEILRQKDSQIVGMESIDREKQRELDLKKSELEKLQSELNVFQDLIGVRHNILLTSTSYHYQTEFQYFLIKEYNNYTNLKIYNKTNI